MKQFYIKNNKNGYFDEHIIKSVEKVRILSKQKDLLGQMKPSELDIFIYKVNDYLENI